MRAPVPIGRLPSGWLAKGLVRALILLAAAAAVAAVAGAFGIAHDYGYLRAAILTGTRGGPYHTLATQLAERAMREHGQLAVVSTAGSIENVRRLAAPQPGCGEKFAFIQDGTPVPADAGIELLGRLPKQEALLLLARQGNAFRTFADLRGAAIGIGPQDSGTAYLMRQLFAGPDLQALGVQLVNHELTEQAELVAAGKLDLAAFVMEEDSEFARATITRHGLDIVSPKDLDGLIARYPWLSLGVIPAGRYDLVRALPAADRQIARLATFVVANACAKRADRIAFLMLLGAELPGFVRGNPPSSTSPATKLRLAPEAHQFFLTGEPELADRYFPWLVNLMSPAYWVYLAMTVTVLFNGLNVYSRFRLWRLDSAREKLEAEIKLLVDPRLTTHAQMREHSGEHVMASPQRRAAAASIMERLIALRERCRRQTSSIVTPMGNEMYYRYQQSLIDDAMTTVATLLQGAGAAAVPPGRSRSPVTKGSSATSA
jgi:TRAP-type uncharacterized transport system substrate-binding protein